MPAISWLLLKAFFWRLREKYVIRDFHPLVFFYVFGMLLSLLGLALGIAVTVLRFLGNELTAATVVLVALLLIFGPAVHAVRDVVRHGVEQGAEIVLRRDVSASGTVTSSTASKPIGLSAPYVDEAEEEAVLEVLRSGRLAFGPMIERFERDFAERVGAPYVATVSSGTAGLHLCVRVAGISPGDEVVTTPLSFIASANSIVYEGGVPVFVDVDERTLNLDPAAVEAAITPKTKALLLVDLFGYPLDFDAFQEIAQRRGLAIIEDACEALGATYRGRPVGSFGHPAVFAFYPNKQITTGEGGAVALGTEEEWELVKSLANHGRTDRGETFAPRTHRLQLPPRRVVGSAGRRAAGEARPDPRRCATRWRLATTHCSPTWRVSVSSAPTTRSTGGPGSCTSSSSTRRPSARR